jgi:hypothetical protein
LIQQSLGQSRNMPATSPDKPAASAAPAPSDPATSQDSEPMKDVLKQLFNH